MLGTRLFPSSLRVCRLHSRTAQKDQPSSCVGPVGAARCAGRPSAPGSSERLAPDPVGPPESHSGMGTGTGGDPPEGHSGMGMGAGDELPGHCMRGAQVAALLSASMFRGLPWGLGHACGPAFLSSGGASRGHPPAGRQRGWVTQRARSLPSTTPAPHAHLPSSQCDREACAHSLLRDLRLRETKEHPKDPRAPADPAVIWISPPPGASGSLTRPRTCSGARAPRGEGHQQPQVVCHKR